MKRFIILLLALMMLLTACSGVEADKPAITDSPAPSETAAPVETPVPTPVPEPSLAICMNITDNHVYRQSQLGFIEACEEMGYKDISIIGTNTGNVQEQYSAALKWAESLEGAPGGILIYSEDSEISAFCAQLKEKGVFVGVAGESFNAMSLLKGADFVCSFSYEEVGRQHVEYILNNPPDERGVVLAFSGDNYMQEDDIECNVLCASVSEVASEESYTGNLRGITRSEDFEPYTSDARDAKTSPKAFKRLFTRYRDSGNFEGVYVTDKGWLTNFIEPMEELRLPSQGIYLYGTDAATAEYLDAYEKGTIAALAIMPYYGKGAAGAEMLHRLLNGEDIKEYNYLSAEMLTEETEEKLLPKYRDIIIRAADDSVFEKYKR